MIVVAMVPAVMIMVHPMVTMVHGDLVASCERVPILVAMPAISGRPTEHHGAAWIHGATRLPVAVGCIHAVMESATVHIVEVWGRDIPTLTILIALLLLTVLISRPLLTVLISRLLLTVLISGLLLTVLISRLLLTALMVRLLLTILVARLLLRWAVLLRVQRSHRSCQ